MNSIMNIHHFKPASFSRQDTNLQSSLSKLEMAATDEIWQFENIATAMQQGVIVPSRTTAGGLSIGSIGYYTK